MLDPVSQHTRRAAAYPVIGRTLQPLPAAKLRPKPVRPNGPISVTADTIAEDLAV